jgi:hypothetical protein
MRSMLGWFLVVSLAGCTPRDCDRRIAALEAWLTKVAPFHQAVDPTLMRDDMQLVIAPAGVTELLEDAPSLEVRPQGIRAWLGDDVWSPAAGPDALPTAVTTWASDERVKLQRAIENGEVQQEHVPRDQVVLVVDARVRWQVLAQVIEACRAGGVRRLGLAVSGGNPIGTPPETDVGRRLAELARRPGAAEKAKGMADLARDVLERCEPLMKATSAVQHVPPAERFAAFTSGAPAALRTCGCRPTPEEVQALVTALFLPARAVGLVIHVELAADASGAPLALPADTTWQTAAAELARHAGQPVRASVSF